MSHRFLPPLTLMFYQRNFLVSQIVILWPINSVRYGTPVGYIGPRQPWVSCNLQLAAQHPYVVSSNLTKKIALGHIAGFFQAPPLPNLQCHPVGVIPKKHSNEWRTIYHFSYPEGDSANDHIPKDLYTLQYVQVDDAIRILKSLGPGSFISKNRPQISLQANSHPSQRLGSLGDSLEQSILRRSIPPLRALFGPVSL